MEFKKYLITLDPKHFVVDNKIPEEYLVYFQQAKDAGHQIVFVSSQSYYWSKPFLKAASMVDYFIANNGNLLVDVKQGQVNIFEKISNEIYVYIKSLAVEYDLNFYVDLPDVSYYVTRTSKEFGKLNPFYNGIKIRFEDIDKYISEESNIIQVALKQNEDTIASLKDFIAFELGNLYTVELNDDNFCVIYPAKSNKFDGVRYMKTTRELNSYSHIAIGQEKSDLDLMLAAQHGILLMNAHKDLGAGKFERVSCERPRCLFEILDRFLKI